MSWNSFMRPTLTVPHLSKIQANQQILREHIKSRSFVFGRSVSNPLRLRVLVLLTLHFIGMKITRQS